MYLVKRVRDALFFVSVPVAVVLVLACGGMGTAGNNNPNPPPTQHPVKAGAQCSMRGEERHNLRCTRDADGNLHWVRTK